MTGRPGLLDPLDGRSATLFLLAGGLLLVFAANSGIRAFTDGGYPVIHSVFGPGGFFLGLVGLLGIAPALAEQRPKSTRVIGVVAAIPAVGWFVITVFGLGSSAGVLPGMSVVFPPAFPVLVFLTTILAYVTFGVVSLRAGVHSRSVTGLLFVPVVPFISLILTAAVLEPVVWGEFAIDSGHALAHLALGLALRYESVPADRPEPAVDATP